MKPAALIALSLTLAALAVFWYTRVGPSSAERATTAPASAERIAPSLFLPPESELAADLADAVDFRVREDFDRVHDAWDPGELLEHATLTQQAMAQRPFGLDAMFRFGDELFEYEFRPRDGLGNRLRGRDMTHAGPRERPNMRRVHKQEFGGPDSFSCATCHFKGGPDGAGTLTQNAFLRSDGISTSRADERNAPHVLGLGPVQALAAEMTRELDALVQAGKRRAAAQPPGSGPIAVALITKGVDFGTVRVSPTGELDTSSVNGVDSDLVIRPFGWKGHQATIRAMSEESFRIHLGVVSTRLQLQAKAGGLDKKVYGDGPWYDLDRDGVSMEIDSGMLSTIVVYLAQLEVPEIQPPREPALLDLFGRGSAVFDAIGCASCHRKTLPLVDPVIEVRPQLKQFADVPPIRLDVAMDGEHPKITPQNALRTAYDVNLFSDLKRHDMGPELATPGPQGSIPASVFLTRPLWGLAETAPYLHDGRAPTVHDAIRLHGGEASPARDAYLALEETDKSALRVYLMSLTRHPKLFVP